MTVRLTVRRRWTIVALGVALITAMPYVISRLPAGRSDVSAATLLSRIAASASVAYSGYAQADGGLALPSIGAFDDLPDLLGGQTSLRVWWRAPSDWRVDSITVTGEQDVHRDAAGLWLWNYESNRAIRVGSTTAVAARLPRADDLAPPTLARRLLSQARVGEVSRIGARRIAGSTAAGLRLMPPQSVSTIAHVDVWAQPSTGLPVAVEVVSRSGGVGLSSTMLDLSTDRPSSEQTGFSPPSRARVETDSVTDIVSAVNQYVNVTPPDRLAGLARAPSTSADSVGIYGRGVTTLVAVPLPGRLAFEIADRVSAVAAANDGAATLSIGPLTLRFTPPSADGSRWLLAGTITQRALANAEKQLPAVSDTP